MLNSERIEDLRRYKEVISLSIQAEKERKELQRPFKDFMESAYYNIPKQTGDGDENVQFTRTDMFRAFQYGYKEAKGE